jgi:hypothetical protein
MLAVRPTAKQQVPIEMDQGLPGRPCFSFFGPNIATTYYIRYSEQGIGCAVWHGSPSLNLIRLSHRDGVPMSDVAFGPIDVAGRWVGFYRDLSEEDGTYPIEAEIRLTGERIAGEMYDQITDQSNLLETLLERFAQDLTDEKRHGLQATIDQFGAGNVLVNSQLPDTSDIAGKISGNTVSFTKTYRGNYTTRLIVAGRVLGSAFRRGHRVVYFGHLEPVQMCIAGQWIIR